MSSNQLHITRSNYEEYFLLYVDGELTPEQSDAVEAFAALHPDLQEELDILLTTRLDAEMVSLDKTFLMADQMKVSAIDEDLLLYIDNELAPGQKDAVEKTLATDPASQFQLNLLMQAKLPAEAIVYPYKKELYRHTIPALRPVVWFRVAAAVFVVLATSFMWWMSQGIQPDAPVAIQQPAVTTLPTKPVDNNIAIKENKAAPAALSPAEETAEAQTIAALSTPIRKASDNRLTTQTVQDEGTAAATLPVNTSDIARVTEPATVSTVSTDRIEGIEKQQQIINNPSVTTPATPAYTTIETASNNAAEEVAAVSENNDRKGSVKGFLRKATRLIERRTGINPANDDEELLIGAMAIKLK